MMPARSWTGSIDWGVLGGDTGVMSVPRCNILSVSTLFPTPERPQHGVFVRRRMEALMQAGPDGEGRPNFQVIVPVPWFPCGARIFGDYGRYARIPASANWAQLGAPSDGGTSLYPRYLHIPRISLARQWRAVYRATIKACDRAGIAAADVDSLDAQYGYPDGPAVAALAARWQKPYVITVRGSDVTEIFRLPSVQPAIRDAFMGAAKIIAVAEALRRDLIASGIPADKIVTVRNGVDGAAFRAPVSAPSVQRARTLLAAGWLIPRKRMDWCVRAVAAMPGTYLRIAGEGPLRRSLGLLARDLGCADRVTFLGAVAPADMPDFMASGDCFLLASEREGWPNVALEALASGCKLVVTDAGSVADFVRPPYGMVVDVGDLAGFIDAARAMQAQTIDRHMVQRYGATFDWESAVKIQRTQYLELVERPKIGS